MHHHVSRDLVPIRYGHSPELRCATLYTRLVGLKAAAGRRCLISASLSFDLTTAYLSSRARDRLRGSMSWPNRSGGSAVAIEVDVGATPMKRVAAACFVGSTIEFYDFHIY